MNFKANSMRDAMLEAEKVFKCNRNQLKVFVIKSPGNKLCGIIKTPGVYYIEPIKKLNNDSSESKDKNGYVEIVSGKVIVTDPGEEGKYATIIVDDPKIDVLVNGKKVYGATILTSNDRVEIKSLAVEPVTKVNAFLSKDKMQAILEIIKIPGKEYYVKDAKRSNVVFICSDFKEIQPSPPALDECLMKLKELNVDMNLVKIEKIEELINVPNGGSAVVAEGKYPINGSNSKIKFFFRNTNYRNPDFDTEKKVNLLDHTIIPTVNVGEVLAIKTIPAIPGKDGVTVTGEVIKARNGKDIPLRAGNGAVLLDNDTKVVATSNGRPMYKKGVISVIPTIVIPHDVDISTGNLHFEGDIVIRGNIAENIKVSAGGDITVFGHVYHANVCAKGNIRVHGNIINSRVSAGSNILNSMYYMPKLAQLLDIVKEFKAVADLGKTSLEHEDIRRRLLKVVISKKNIIDNLIKEAENMMSLSNDEEMEELAAVFEDVKRILTGINAQCLENTGLISMLYEKIKSHISEAEELYGNRADIIFENAQNSFIKANGSIVITERGCYQTNLLANAAILFRKPSSVVRGGTLVARNYIKMGFVGTPTGALTYCKVLDKKGKIDAAHYSNTVLSINNKVTVIK
ncbi:MAG TPA: DUF342 domain-containing protein [Clostridiaceae bacterium]|nr:DUF342 domain-containing protein [Clostridiaceae bacterium]